MGGWGLFSSAFMLYPKCKDMKCSGPIEELVSRIKE
jgi:hypothetical protein